MNGRVNLIVHEEMLRKDIREVRKGARHFDVLKRIDSVRSGECGAMRNLEGFYFERVLEICGGASEVRLFGCYREACLDFTYAELQKAGIVCSYDIEGTI
jgi:hypothetical protein